MSNFKISLLKLLTYVLYTCGNMSALFFALSVHKEKIAIAIFFVILSILFFTIQDKLKDHLKRKGMWYGRRQSG